MAQRGKEARATWQRLAAPTRRVLFYAQEDAAQRNSSTVGTGHLLFGLVRENDNGATQVLGRLGVSLEGVRLELQEQLTCGPDCLVKAMRLSPRAAEVLKLACGEARRLDDPCIGTAHLLLAMLHEEDSRLQRAQNRPRCARQPAEGAPERRCHGAASCLDDQGGSILIKLGVHLERAREEARNLSQL